MGTLVTMHYPTKLFAKLADHTYVQCGSGGKAWSCWGGKTGGKPLREGTGSTKQADAIAEPNERAGITCYLINGVCHQAANRILFPAGITVRGAKGYHVSESLFGTYGRTRGPLGTCKAPFDKHQNVDGDVPECNSESGRQDRGVAESESEKQYLRGVLKIYAKADDILRAEESVPGPELERFQLELFMHKVDYSLRSKVDKTVAGKLANVRVSAERSRMKIEDWFARKEMTFKEFVTAFDNETVAFQNAVAGVLKAGQNRALFDLSPGDVVTLADPSIVEQIYAGR